MKREIHLSEQSYPFSKYVTDRGMHFGDQVEGYSTQRIPVCIPGISPDDFPTELLRSKTNRCVVMQVLELG